MNSKFFGLGAKLALCLVATLGTLTSCYEKEDITTVIDTSSKSVNYVISGSIANSASLKGIEGALITVTAPSADIKPVTGDEPIKTDLNGLFSVKYEFKTKQGASQDEINALIKKVCGAYTVAVTADGYNKRSTQVELQFSAFDNQTITTHLDFLLKSQAIQGAAEEIVAGSTDQTVDITGASADGEGTTVDKLTVPAGAFGQENGQNIAKTITIERAPLAVEEEAAAVRVYEGKPDGTVFEKPLQIEFAYPDALVGNDGLKVLYAKSDGTWVADTKAKVVKKAANTYVAEIYHFSKFKVGLPTSESGSTEATISLAPPTTTIVPLDSLGAGENDKKFYNSDNSNKEYQFVSTQEFGSAYETGKSVEDVLAGITDATVRKAAIYQMTNFIDNTVMNRVNIPTDKFQTKIDKQSVLVDAHSNLLYITVKRTVKTYAVTIKVGGQSYTATFKEYIGYQYKGVCYDYTHGHGIGHGTGHGSDLNAGGGIIDFE